MLLGFYQRNKSPYFRQNNHISPPSGTDIFPLQQYANIYSLCTFFCLLCPLLLLFPSFSLKFSLFFLFLALFFTVSLYPLPFHIFPSLLRSADIPGGSVFTNTVYGVLYCTVHPSRKLAPASTSGRPYSALRSVQPNQPSRELLQLKYLFPSPRPVSTISHPSPSQP
jgi:hypothetical protein